MRYSDFSSVAQKVFLSGCRGWMCWLGLLFVCHPLFAAHVDRLQGSRAALSYLAERYGDVEIEMEEVLADVDSLERPPYYLYNFYCEKDSGMLVVASDDRLGPVVGFTTNGYVSEVAKLPVSFRLWLQMLEREVRRVQTDPKYDKRQLRGTYGFKLPIAVDPLLRTTWGQRYPYNASCPVDSAHGGVRCLTGCTATAMAQVMNYHRWPIEGAKGVFYKEGYHDRFMERFFPMGRYEWGAYKSSYSMRDTLNERSGIAHIGDLLFHCGSALRASYCSRVTRAAAYRIRLGLINNFNYSIETSYMEADMMSPREWHYLLRKELSGRRPVCYDLSAYHEWRNAGHVWVCDGYNKEGLYHFNWGWDGWLDGYYALVDLPPVRMPYGQEKRPFCSQGIVYGIHPEGKGDIGAGLIKIYEGKRIDSDSKRQLRKVFRATVLFETQGSFCDSVELGFGVYRKGKLLGTAFSSSCFSKKCFISRPVYFAFPESWADGKYQLRMIYRRRKGVVHAARVSWKNSEKVVMNVLLKGKDVFVLN